MTPILKRIIAPLLSLLIVMIGVSYLNTFISLRVSVDGYPLFYAGFLYSAYCVGLILGAFYLKKVIFLKGHSRSFSIFAGTLSLIILLQSFTSLPELWVLFRFLTGIAVAGIFIVIESWILLLSSHKIRGIALSIYMIAIYLGQCIGQYGINFASIDSSVPFKLVLIFLIGAMLPVCAIKSDSPKVHELETVDLISLLKKIPLGFLGNLFSGLILGAFYALAPVYGKHIGYSLLQISTMMAVTILGGMTLQWPIGKLSDIFPRRLIIILTCLLSCIFSILIIIYNKSSFITHLQLLFILGGFIFTLYPLSITYCCDFYPSSGITAISSAALLFFGLGCIIGPIVASAFMFFAPYGLFIYFAILSLFLTIFAIYRAKTSPPPPEDNKDSYHTHPGMAENFPNTD